MAETFVLEHKRKVMKHLNGLSIARKHKKSFLMSQTAATRARRAESQLKSREGSWFADEDRDKLLCGWDGTEQAVNFHFLVLDLFIPFSVTQKSHLKTSSK